MHLSGLFIYPVKSLRGLAVPSAQLDELGLVGDRRFMVVNDRSDFLTQRTLPRLALIETDLSRDTLTLRNPDQGSVIVRLSRTGATLPVQVWHDTVAVEDCGDEARGWLSDFLHHPCRLVRIGSAYDRPIKPGKSKKTDQVSFADGYPLLVIGENSLAHLNDRIQTHGADAVPMDRFRPNLVLRGSPPYAEDSWNRVQIGDAVFRTAGPCARCVITTTDQQSAERGKEPLRTLATYRRDPDNTGNINFGQNLINESKRGTLRIGDPVELL